MCGTRLDPLDTNLVVADEKEEPSVTVTYFLPDNKKTGGRYITVSGNVRKLDGVKRVMVFADETRIPIGDIRYIESDLFRVFEY